MKYIKDFSSLSDAKSATLYSPTVALVTDSTEDKLFYMTTDTTDAVLEITGDTLSKATISEHIEASSLPEGAIDLGLPSGLKWCSHNVGATLPCDYGLLFQFGRTDGYEYGSALGTSFNAKDGLIKTSDVPTTTSGKKYAAGDTLGLDDDAARTNMGGSWRMPTYAEITELLNNTNNTWCTCTFLGEGHESHTVYGRKFVSTKDATKVIFIPAAGCFGGIGGAFLDGGAGGSVWSSSVYSDDADYAYGLGFDSDNCLDDGYLRCNGLSVRGVC